MVRRTWNGAKFCERPPCASGMLWAQLRPKTSARRPPSQNRPAEKGQNGGCAIALVGGWGEVGSPDSDGAKLYDRPPCAHGMPRARPRPKALVPKPPSGKGPKRGVGYSLGGGLGPTSSAGLGMGETLRAAYVCPRDVPGTDAPKNERPKAPVPRPPSRKGPKRGVSYSHGGGVGRSWSAGLGWGQTLRPASVCPRDAPGTAAPEGPRPKTAQRKRAKTGGVL